MFRLALLLLCSCVILDVAAWRLRSTYVREHKTAFIRCHFRRSINVKNAEYGIKSRWTTVTKGIMNHCNGRSRCSVKASNGNFGDPAHGHLKALRIKYRCVRKAHLRSATGYEHRKSAYLNCRYRNSVIQVVSAKYGKRGHSWKNGKGKVGAKCNGLERCKVPAQNYMFGDPAVGIVKVLIVKYRCMKAY